MTLLLLSLGSAVVYGAADFFGGAAARRVPARSVLLISLPVGLAVLVAGALATGDVPTRPGLVWGLAAGLAGGTGLIVFYGALARGPMSVVAPVAALISALLPVAAGLAQGERLTPSVLVGVLICLVAICLVSMEGGAAGPRRSARGPVLAVISGACFGIFFILLREAGRHGGLWALSASRLAGLAVVVAIALAGWALMRRSATRRAAAGHGVIERGALVIAVTAGILDSLANVLYLFATRAGMLSLAAVLTSLYPAITVLLARVVYSERLRMVQRLGVALALAGVALVSAG
jgi:drug/metabolite transporter (DMT)-like permease